MKLYGPAGNRVSPMRDIKTTVVDKPGSKEIVQEVVPDKTVIQKLIDIEEKEFNKDTFSVEEPHKNLNFPLDIENNITTLSQGNTLIRSDINDSNSLTNLFVTSGRICLNRAAALELLDMDITELDVANITEPIGPPAIDQFEIRNVYRTEDVQEGKHPRDTQQGFDLEETTKDQSNFSFTIGANHHLLIVANGNNWHNEATGEMNREGLEYTWRFTSGETNYDTMAIDKIVAVGRQLSIENIQRRHIGTYNLEVSNKFGKSHAFPVILDVNHPGEVREEKMTLGDNEILTGKYVWVETDQTDQYNENVTIHDAKEVYDFDVEEENGVYTDYPNRWVEVYYQNNRWYRDDNNKEFDGAAPAGAGEMTGNEPSLDGRE